MSCPRRHTEEDKDATNKQDVLASQDSHHISLFGMCTCESPLQNIQVNSFVFWNGAVMTQSKVYQDLYCTPGVSETWLHLAQAFNSGFQYQNAQKGWAARYILPQQSQFCEPAYWRLSDHHVSTPHHVASLRHGLFFLARHSPLHAKQHIIVRRKVTN